MALIPALEKEEADDVAKAIYAGFEEQSGSVPAWVKVMAHDSAILAGFVSLFKAVMGPGEVDVQLKWKIGYLVSETLKCEFCVSVTKAMLMKLGADEATIECVKDLSCVNDTEHEILAIVRDVTEDGSVDQHHIFERLRGKLSPKELVEIASVIGFFNYINRFNNLLGVEAA
jgi:alkylhydroperoxidase family enzyme